MHVVRIHKMNKGENKMNGLITQRDEFGLVTLRDDYAESYTNTLSPETKRAYLSTIKEFFGVHDLLDIKVDDMKAVTPDMANAWAHILLDKGQAKSTINRKLSAMQNFYGFISRRSIRIAEYNPFETKEGCIRFRGATKSYSQRIALTEEQISAIVTAIPQDNFESKADMLVAKRDYIVMAILITAGLRRAELCSINIGDIIQVDGKYVINVLGKGDKTRMMVLANSIKRKIDEYVNLRGITYDDVDAPLIIGHGTNSDPDAHVSDVTVARIVKRYTKAANIDSRLVSPHTLRHTFCTELLKMGEDITDVQDLMGHASVSTTRRYDHINRTLGSNSSAKLAKKYDI